MRIGVKCTGQVDRGRNSEIQTRRSIETTFTESKSGQVGESCNEACRDKVLGRVDAAAGTGREADESAATNGRKRLQ